jgi:hypothetical protein
VEPARDRNLAATIEDDFALRVVAEIRKTRKTPIQGVRIHGSGDFYDQAYLEKWFMVACMCSDIHFKANTRSWMLDYTGKPDNLILRYSIDMTTRHDTIEVMKKKADAFAYIQGSEPKGTIVCSGHCGFDEDECSICYDLLINITYSIH